MKFTIFATFMLLCFQVRGMDIIAHRGASGYLPEHSKEAAVMAFMQGADYIEQDLVLSKDDHLIVLHDIHLETISNVEQVFATRARADGRFYVIDFTLSELRQLSLHERETENAKQVFPNRYQGTAHFAIATFSEHIELIQELNRQLDKNVGWYPEIKSPEWHLSEGKDIAKALIDALNRHQLNHKNAKIIVQSFEPNSLIKLKKELGIQVPTVQLIAENSWQESSANYENMLSAIGLKKIAAYADGVGPWLPQVIKSTDKQVQPWVTKAQEIGLFIHPFTHREEDNAGELSPQERFYILKQAGIDGIFTDQVMPYMLQ